MQIQDIFTGHNGEINLRIKPLLKDENFNQHDNIYVTITFTKDSYWLVISDNERYEIEGTTPNDNANLDLITASKPLVLLIKANDKKAELKARLFTNIIYSEEIIEIGFGDKIHDDMDRKYSRQIGSNKKEEWLKQELFIYQKNDNRVLLLTNANPDDNGFRIFGERISVNVIRNEDNKLEINSITGNSKNQKASYAISSIVQIKNISEVGLLNEIVADQLNSMDTTKKYITTWEKYKDIEKEISQRFIEEVGFLKVSEIKKVGFNKYKLSTTKDDDNSWTEVEPDEMVELCDKREFPDYSKKQDRFVGRIIDFKDTSITIYSDNKIPQNIDNPRYLCISLIGDIQMQKRRERALEKIKENNVPMPQLPAILEGLEVGDREYRKIKPLTSKVKKIFGPQGPNEMQEEALDVALNTPDIAIIQGPPGTGKTKIISALAERLVEIYKKDGRPPEMNILLTAFQHDAVENMAIRTEVLGLPTIKSNSKIREVSTDTVDPWIKKKIELLEAEQLMIEPNEYELTYSQLKGYFLEYIETLDHEKAINNLSQFAEENISSMPHEIIQSIENLSNEKAPKNSRAIKKIEDCLRNIRTDIHAYKDDGEFHIERFLKNYEIYKNDIPELDDKYLKNLEHTLASDDISQKKLSEIDKIKIQYLSKLTSDEEVKDISLPNTDIEKIFKDLIDFFSQVIKSQGSIYSSLMEYENDLKTNNERVKDTVLKYQALIAATTQGSASNYVYHLKDSPFDTVIVDEAARTNPLDLLIPLTRAKRRIILVGDHKQLPHLLDNGIEKQVHEDRSITGNTLEHLKVSIFERFFNILKNLEKKDLRKRIVTLNKQYRMHPVIGDFVSETFYEGDGGTKIESGVEAKDGEHNIQKYLGKVAVSINIPNFKEKEIKNQSVYRPIEAKKAIKQAKEILDSDPQISVGIITFYSAQVRELFRFGKSAGICAQNGNKIDIAEIYKSTIDGQERLRIGTVDAFQGKEFDVVILSLVRSNKYKIENEKDVRRKFGFLTSYNRLNVALSRAKKLLIAIGDEDMFCTDEAKNYTYGLYEFYNKLIGSDYGVSI